MTLDVTAEASLHTHAAHTRASPGQDDRAAPSKGNAEDLEEQGEEQKRRNRKGEEPSVSLSLPAPQTATTLSSERLLS